MEIGADACTVVACMGLVAPVKGTHCCSQVPTPLALLEGSGSCDVGSWEVDMAPEDSHAGGRRGGGGALSPAGSRVCSWEVQVQELM